MRCNKTHIKAWREYRSLTQEQVASRIDMSVPNLSRLERGKIPYSQAALEALAVALDCTVADLVSRPPPKPGHPDLWSVLNGMTEEEQETALRVVAAMRGKAA
jgi:transcriptional regulator with XRE-family HTH domain